MGVEVLLHSVNVELRNTAAIFGQDMGGGMVGAHIAGLQVYSRLWPQGTIYI